MTDFELLRRRFLQTGVALGAAGALPWKTVAASESSPDLEKFVQPLPIPAVRKPDGRKRGADYYEISIREFERKVHPDLPPTTFWGFDGQVPGPVIKARRNKRIKVNFDNSELPEEHLFEVDDLIHGTKLEDYGGYDGPVPEVRTAIHQHGLKVEEASDGQGAMWKAPDGTTGPRFVKHVHDLPNRQDRTTTTYHDHAKGISRLNNYAGLNGFYIIESPWEKWLNLPRGEYDVPIMLQDKTFNEDGSLHYPDSFVADFAGDTAFVNGAVWPYMEVEPRRYRFRLVNQSNARTFGLSLENDHGHDAPPMYQIAPDHGFLEEVVSIGHHGDLDSLLLAPFERAEVVVDFSEYAGATLTLTNGAEFPFSGTGDHGGHDDHDGGMDHGDDGMDGMSTGDHGDDEMSHDDGDMDHGDGDMGHGDDGMDHGGGDFPGLPELMQFRVGHSANGADRSTHPADLYLPHWPKYHEYAAAETRQMTMGMRMGEDPALHVLNGKTSYEGGDYAKPQYGTTEIWELKNEGHHSHPIHLHLVDFEVIGRGPDGTDDPAPNERGPKDTVRVDPGETVRIITRFDGFAGKYMWHCHVLEHEDHAMMRPFEVVTGDFGRHPGWGKGWGGRRGRKGRKGRKGRGSRRGRKSRKDRNGWWD
ncbi:multicopper oxidase family protein [Halosolutus gelatinilyticus]|uniref:multicopper oxidase family protein n=1 Tax=Halosolutus gelatinilyticus TaxID=2931975 RepID=UPI001FF6B11B|nr:multicopper oxidase domain-containing protein [Halosolutus gelatinilyticus]